MDDLIGVAAVITAITTPVVLVIVAFLSRKVTHIDHAVNGKDKGAQTMVSQVDDMHKGDFPPVIDTNGAAVLPLVKLLVEDMNRRNVSLDP
jgi:uncharacterized protein YoxC